jgi:uncharacterized membrane protein
MKHMRATMMTAAALSAFLAGTQAAAAAPTTSSESAAAPAATTARSCRPTATRLPDVGHGSGAIAFSGSTVVGSVTDARGRTHPAIWRHGHLQVVRDRRISTGEANDINARGEIIGDADNFTKAWELRRGRITILRDVHGSSSIYARRINSRGQIAGAADNLDSAARWSSATAAPVLLAPQRGDKFSFSKGINDHGAVAGDSDAADGTPHPAVWNATGHIHVFAGAFGSGTPGDLFEINNSGESAGESFQVGPQGNIIANAATIWSRRGVAHDLGYLRGLNQSTAFGLSGSGHVAGESASFSYAHGTARSLHAFVWPGHGPLLALPVPHLSFARSQSLAHQISDNGTVAGSAGSAHGQLHAYIWTCAFQQAFRPHRRPTGAAVPSQSEASGTVPASPSRLAAFMRHAMAGDS